MNPVRRCKSCDIWPLSCDMAVTYTLGWDTEGNAIKITGLTQITCDLVTTLDRHPPHRSPRRAWQKLLPGKSQPWCAKMQAALPRRIQTPRLLSSDTASWLARFRVIDAVSSSGTSGVRSRVEYSLRCLQPSARASGGDARELVARYKVYDHWTSRKLLDFLEGGLFPGAP